MPSPDCVHGELQGTVCVCDEGWFGSRCNYDELILSACAPLGGTCYHNYDCCGVAWCDFQDVYRNEGVCMTGRDQDAAEIGILRGFSPCGSYVVLSFYFKPKGYVFLDVETLDSVRVLNLPLDTDDYDANFAEDLLLLTSRTGNGEVRRISTGQTLFELPAEWTHTKLSPAGRYLLPGRADSEEWSWYDMVSDQFRQLPAGDTYIPPPGGNIWECGSYFNYERIRKLVMAPDETSFVQANILGKESGSPSGEFGEQCLPIWTPQEGTLSRVITDTFAVTVFPDNWKECSTLVYNKDGSMLAMATTKNEIVLFDNNGATIARYPGHAADFGPDGEIAILVSESTATMYIPGEETPYLEFNVSGGRYARHIALSPDGNTLAATRIPGIAVYNARTGELQAFRPWR